MNADPDCIFCRIVAGEIPSFKLLEDDRILSFMDINPANEGHCLVIPKAHAPNLYEADDESLAAVATACRRVADAVRRTLDPPGISVAQANGPAPGSPCSTSTSTSSPAAWTTSSSSTGSSSRGTSTRSAASPSASAPTSHSATAASTDARDPRKTATLASPLGRAEDRA